MNELPHRWPIFLRVSMVAGIVGLAGLLTYHFGKHFVDPATARGFQDDCTAIGRAMMSACSLLCLAAMVLVIVHSIRTRTFTWRHGGVLLFGGMVGLIDAVVNAHPW